MKKENDAIAAAMGQNPSAVLALFKVQAVIRQRKADENKPKQRVSIDNLTKEQAKRIADKLCQSVQWGNEWIQPEINA